MVRFNGVASDIRDELECDDCGLVQVVDAVSYTTTGGESLEWDCPGCGHHNEQARDYL